MRDNSAILVAGGSGIRMNSEIPKQFLLLAGQPVLMHTLRLFHNYDPEMKLLVTIPEKHIKYWRELCVTYAFSIPHSLVSGGNTRFESVKNALEQISGEGLVAIHDGVRPLVSMETIRRTFEEAGRAGNAVPVVSVQESIRETGPSGNKMVDRENLRIVQTPQVFRKDLIKRAYDAAPPSKFTDDASVLELLGIDIHLVQGNPENIKITCPSDLRAAEAIIAYPEV